MKMILSTIEMILTSLGLIAALTLHSGAAEQSLHKILKSGTRTAEVQIDRSKVTVRLSPNFENNPSSVLFSFYDENNRPVTLELKSLSATNFEEPGVSSYGASSASLTPSQQSFIGIELRIPLSQGEPEVLR